MQMTLACCNAPCCFNIRLSDHLKLFKTSVMSQICQSLFNRTFTIIIPTSPWSGSKFGLVCKNNCLIYSPASHSIIIKLPTRETRLQLRNPRARPLIGFCSEWKRWAFGGQLTAVWSRTWWRRDAAADLHLSSPPPVPLPRSSRLCLLCIQQQICSALFFMSPVFINRPNRPRPACFKITFCQYSISEEGENMVTMRGFLCLEEQREHNMAVELRSTWNNKKDQIQSSCKLAVLHF